MRRTLLTVLIPLGFSACSAGAVQRDAICERSAAIEIAVPRTGELPDSTRAMNAAVLRNQLDEDMSNLSAALDIAPDSIVGDLSTIIDRLRNLYGALELLDWDAARFVANDRLDTALEALDSVNTRRHLARLSDYLLRSCTQGEATGDAPPDSVIVMPSTSTSMPSLEDPIPSDEELLTAHVAMGSAMAEAEGVEVTVEQAECLGSEADQLAIESDTDDVDTWRSKFQVSLKMIFSECGVTLPDRPVP